MKKAYHEELDEMLAQLNAVKMELDTFCAKRHADKDIVEAIKEEYDLLMSKGDHVLSSFGSCMRRVRAAMAVRLK